MIAEIIKDYILDNYGHENCADLNGTTHLIDLNIIDSFTMFDLVDFLHSRLGVSVPLEEIKPENFQTIESIAALAKSIRAGA